MLQAKQKDLKENVKGNLPNKSQDLTREYEVKMREKGALGRDTPETLIHTIWFNNTKYFCLRGNHENRQMRWGGGCETKN